MSTLIIAIVAVAGTIAATSLVCALVFWAFCLKVERSWTLEIPLINTERWHLESVRKRWALVSLVGYALSMGLTMLLTHGLGYAAANLWIMGAASAGILIIGLRAMVHNDRCFENDLKHRYPSYRM